MKRCALFLALLSIGCSSDPESEPAKPHFVVVTFNTGTPQLAGDPGTYVKDWYGTGLSWRALIDETNVFFADVSPNVALFQEIFHPEDCPNIPPEAKPGFVCETWQPGDPTVVQMVLGDGYQVACNLGKPDKCAAVKKTFGKFQGCDADLCLDGLSGAEVPSCGGGSRIGRGVIERTNGEVFTLVNVHGTSGLAQADQDCRVKQFEQVFVDLGAGDGPAANGAQNVIAGDLNTDPVKNAGFDESAQKFSEFVGEGKPFHFVSDVGESAEPSYAGLFNIDHVASDAFVGSCFSAGVTAAHPGVTEMPSFDHHPLVCTLSAK